jgi:hypothetical protein
VAEKSRIRSLTRLAIGGIINGLDTLSRNMDAWEDESPIHADREDKKNASQIYDVAGIARERTLADTGDASEQPQTTALHGEVLLPNDNEAGVEKSAYLVAGLLVAGQERLESTLKLADRATRLAGNWAELLGGPVYRSRVMRPVRQGFSDLTEHGQLVVDRWMNIGRSEVETGRRSANAALTEQVDTAIEYLTANQEVQELVQSQSAGLVDEVIEETRERTVSIDNFLEALVRSVLRLPPRWELPAPPDELKQNAEEGVRQYHGRTIHK